MIPSGNADGNDMEHRVTCCADSSVYSPHRRAGSRQGSRSTFICGCPGMITTNQEEWCTTSSPVPSLVRSKLSLRQVDISVTLSRMHEMPQPILQQSVSMLSLSVHLWVQCSGHMMINTKQIADFRRELRGEELISVHTRSLGMPCSMKGTDTLRSPRKLTVLPQP